MFLGWFIQDGSNPSSTQLYNIWYLRHLKKIECTCGFEMMILQKRTACFLLSVVPKYVATAHCQHQPSTKSINIWKFYADDGDDEALINQQMMAKNHILETIWPMGISTVCTHLVIIYFILKSVLYALYLPSSS